MRGNSGFLTWLLSSRCSAKNPILLFGCVFLIVAVSTVQAGPLLNARSRRMIRDVYSEFETQSQNITQPTAGTCLNDGIAVPETSVRCEKKSGCRAIQKTGYCCPDYQCDCERDGKIYANGEKLVDPEEPCKGCYCQGGEILCNDVNCYIRHDCEPKFIAGRCCPEYDNCPPIESGRPPPSTSTTSPPELFVSPSSEPSDAFALSTPSKNMQQEMANSNPLGIKIKEITKPEEIRIIDEKPKPAYQITKPAESTTANQQRPTAVRVDSHLTQTQSNESQTLSVDAHHPGLVSGSESAVSPLPASRESGEDSNGIMSTINSNAAETPIEPINNLENAEANSITDEDALKIARHTASLREPIGNAVSEEIPSSTIMSVSEKVVTEATGKEVVIVDSNGQTKPITVFGVEGLQRGDDVLDEVMEFEEKKIAAKRSDNTKPSSSDLTTESSGYSTGSEIIYDNSETNFSDSKTASEIDPLGSGSDDFVHVLVAESTTESRVPSSFGGSSTASPETEDEPILDAEGADSDDSQAHGSAVHTVYREPDEVAGVSSSTEGPKHMAIEALDDDGVIDEQNPAYPTIGDDLSVYQSQVLLAEEEASAKDEKILPDVLVLLNNTAAHYENGTTLAPESWLKQESSSTTMAEGMPIDDETALIPEERSPGEPQLIPEWERNITNTITQNTTSESSLEEESLIPSGELTDLDASLASGDGPSRIKKERESTTPNPKKLIDIDEDGSGRLEHDPKDDSESLKYQNGNDDSIIKPYVDTGLKSLVTALDDFQKSSLLDILRFA